jgi:uncharacterized damage-inducible protein DinB
MVESKYANLDLAPTWATFNDGLVRLVDYIPDDKMNWSPKPELWNFRGILLHLADARDNWLGHGIEDGVEWTAVWTNVRSKAEIQDALRRTWTRLEGLLGNQAQLDATYNTADAGEPEEIKTGHWIAFHLLEHDIHHRADILHYMALLSVEHPDVGTP